MQDIEREIKREIQRYREKERVATSTTGVFVDSSWGRWGGSGKARSLRERAVQELIRGNFIKK